MPSIPTTGVDFLASESACSAPRAMSSFSATMPSMRSPKPDNQFFVLFTASSRFQFAVSLASTLMPGYLASTDSMPLVRSSSGEEPSGPCRITMFP